MGGGFLAFYLMRDLSFEEQLCFTLGMFAFTFLLIGFAILSGKK